MKDYVLQPGQTKSHALHLGLYFLTDVAKRPPGKLPLVVSLKHDSVVSKSKPLAVGQ